MYERRLDLRDAIASRFYERAGARNGHTKLPGTSFRREMFIHADHPILAIKLSAETPETLAARISLQRLIDPRCELHCRRDESQFVLTGRFPENIAWCILADIDVKGGELTPAANGGFAVHNATETVVYTTVAVALDGQDVEVQARRQLAAISLLVGRLAGYARHVAPAAV